MAVNRHSGIAGAPALKGLIPDNILAGVRQAVGVESAVPNDEIVLADLTGRGNDKLVQRAPEAAITKNDPDKPSEASVQQAENEVLEALKSVEAQIALHGSTAELEAMKIQLKTLSQTIRSGSFSPAVAGLVITAAQSISVASAQPSHSRVEAIYADYNVARDQMYASYQASATEQVAWLDENIAESQRIREETIEALLSEMFNNTAVDGFEEVINGNPYHEIALEGQEALKTAEEKLIAVMNDPNSTPKEKRQALSEFRDGLGGQYETQAQSATYDEFAAAATADVMRETIRSAVVERYGGSYEAVPDSVKIWLNDENLTPETIAQLDLDPMLKQESINALSKLQVQEEEAEQSGAKNIHNFMKLQNERRKDATVELAVAELKYQEALQAVGGDENHPDLVELKENLTDVQTHYDSEMEKVSTNIDRIRSNIEEAARNAHDKAEARLKKNHDKGLISNERFEERMAAIDKRYERRIQKKYGEVDEAEKEFQQQMAPIGEEPSQIPMVEATPEDPAMAAALAQAKETGAINSSITGAEEATVAADSTKSTQVAQQAAVENAQADKEEPSRQA